MGSHQLRLVDLEPEGETFQSLFESCGDCDPLGLELDGEPIGLVLVRYDDAARQKIEEVIGRS